MYFLLAGLMHRFVHLETGLAVVHIRVGLTSMLEVDLFHVPTAVSLVVIAVVIGVSVAASRHATRGQGRRTAEAPSAPPFRTATEEELAALQPLRSRGARGNARTDTQAPPRH